MSWHPTPFQGKKDPFFFWDGSPRYSDFKSFNEKAQVCPFTLIETADVKQVEKYFAAHPAALETRHVDFRYTLLHYAASLGKKDACVFLLNHIGIEDKADDGTTPLLSAVHGYNPAVVRLFLDKGADVQAANDTGETPLLATVRARGFGVRVPGRYDDPVIDLLLAYGADMNAADKNGVSPISLSIEKDDTYLLSVFTVHDPKTVFSFARKAAALPAPKPA
ncbi:MAG: ankyrin repeat domain-containing protein [Alphaproteobacteria bacterium]|nr:ankyrin repeat domain-containing protein [Alphaproteobacteria bacterium]